MTVTDQEHEITIEDFDLLSEWMALEPNDFRRQLDQLANNQRVKGQKARQALLITLRALEALYQKRR